MVKTATLLILWLAGTGMVFGRGAPAPGAPPTAEFIQNKGQWPHAVRFALPLAGGQLFLEKTGFTYALTTPRQHLSLTGDSTARTPRQGHAYRVQLVGAVGSGPSGEQATAELRNYFCGNDSTQWARDVPSFRAVHYPDVYPGIDLRFYENATAQLEYTFTVQPGGQPSAIGLRYDGASGLALDEAGNLRIATRVGTVTELAPRAWQSTGAGRRPVACAFEVRGTEVRFRLGTYDAHLPLVIDPVVVFATYTGSTADNWGHTATYDNAGNLYSAGTVFAQGYPSSPGAFDPSFNGSIDVAIIKYNPAANGAAARVYATYLGGADTDVAHRLVVDAGGQLILFGTTGSSDFPRPLFPFQAFRGGPAITPEYGVEYRHGSDLFVARLSADGRRLVGSTCLGGSANDGLPFAGSGFSSPPVGFLPQLGFAAWRGDVQVDAQGNVYVATSTASADFPGRNSFQNTYRGGTSDALVCQLSPSLAVLNWSAFVGGRGADAAFGLALAPNGLVYVAGGTTSPDLLPTPSAFRPASGGSADGFVAALTPDGQTLRYLCRTGTPDADAVEFVHADATSGIYVAGLSKGQFPASSSSLGGGGIFTQQFTADLSSSLFAASLGNTRTFADLTLTAFRADDCGTLYVAAVGLTAGLPLTEGSRPYESTYVARLSAQGRTLDFAACYSGDHTHGISRFGPDGALYQAICGNCQTGRNTFVIPPQAYSYSTVSAASNCNDASLKVAVAPATGADRRPLCADAPPLMLGGSPAGGTWAGPGVEPAPGGGFRFVPSTALLGDNALTYTPPAGAAGACARRLVVQVLAPLAGTISPVGGPFCVSQLGFSNVRLQAQPPGGEFSGPGVVQGNFYPAEAGPGTHTLTYTFNQNGQCGSAHVVVTVLGTPLVTSADTVMCGTPFRAFQLRASPVGGTWSGLGVSPTGRFDPTALGNVNNLKASYVATAVYAYNSPDGCVSRRGVRIVLIPDAPTLLQNAVPPCSLRPDVVGYPPYTVRLPSPFADYLARYYWDFGDGETSPLYTFGLPDVQHTYTRAGTFTPVLHVSYEGGCSRTVSLAPVVLGEARELPNIITPNNDGLNEFFVQRLFCELPDLRIFSRWGQEVYHAARYQNDWNAPKLPAGLYYYVFQGERRQTLKGWLEVRR